MLRFAAAAGILILTLLLDGCAATPGASTHAPTGLPVPAPATGTPVTTPAIIYIVPTTAAYVAQSGIVNDLRFATFDRGPGADHDMLSVKRDGAVLTVERKRANSSNIGSGAVYRVGVVSNKTATGYQVELKPLTYSTYKEGLVLSFPVPSFTDGDLTAFLMTPMLHYRIEVDSEFNSESTFANLKRLLQSRPFATGERDPVTNKIFTQQFAMPYRGKEVLLTAEAFPYRNGSKMVMNLRLPAVFTSANTIDYNVILEEVTAKLREVISA